MKPLNLLSGLISRKKALLAFEFGIVLSEAAKELGVEMTPQLVEKAEKLLQAELINNSASDFACKMSVYTLAILEPKDL